MIPENMKVLVFNNELSVKDSIEAMIKEDIYCSMIWNSETNKFIGIFTIRDFLNLIIITYNKVNNLIDNGKKWINSKNLFNLAFHHTESNLNDLDVIMENDSDTVNTFKSESSTNSIDRFNSLDNCESPIKNITEFFKLYEYLTLNDYIIDLHTDIYLNYKFITVGLDENLKESINLLKKHKVHRIIIEEKSNSQITGFISQETIFDYFINNYYSTENINFFKIPLIFIEKFLIQKSMLIIKNDESIISAFRMFWEMKISILPVYENEQSNIVGFLYLKDIFYLFSNAEKFSLTDPISKILHELYKDIDESPPLGKERVIFCNLEEENLKDVFEKMAISPEKKIVIKKGEHYCGIVSITDIFSLLSMECCENDNLGTI